MIKLKSKKDIEILAQGGKILSNILKELKNMVVEGAFSDDIEMRANFLIKKAGGSPAFLGYTGAGKGKYPSALCMSINEDIVHAPASVRREIKLGDVVSLDIGLVYKGFYTDMATTIAVGDVDDKIKELIRVTKKTLEEAVLQCKVGNSISAIGKRIEDVVSGSGFGIVRELVGHGVGYDVHEDPVVPNFYDKSTNKIIMQEGLVIAIEPMIVLGGSEIEKSEGGWAYKTCDNSIAVHFEATVAITKDDPIILTPII